MKKNNFKNKKVTIWGLGVHGGAEGLVKYLAQKGADIKIADLKPKQELQPTLKNLAKFKNIKYHLGKHSWSDFKSAEIIFKNPAIPEHSEWIPKIKKAKIPLSSEMNLFFQTCPSQNIIGVTGTNGKSTTAFLIYQILKEKFPRRIFFGGNIGGSLLSELPKIKKNDLVVLELSSFQLQDLGRIKRSPKVAVILNITPDHLDRHASFQEYLEAKKNILKFQNHQDLAVLNCDDLDILKIAKNSKAQKYFFSFNPLKIKKGTTIIAQKIYWLDDKIKIEIMPVSDIKIPGRHNLENILAVIAIAQIFKLKPEICQKVISHFSGLEHRIELVGKIKGIKYYNDSKSTTPESTIAALNSFTQPVILIAGGKDKGVKFANLARLICQKTKILILIGQTAEEIEKRVKKYQTQKSILKKIYQTANLLKAIQIAKTNAHLGDIVLLSPACPSTDQFKTFEERGRIFKAQVRKK